MSKPTTRVAGAAATVATGALAIATLAPQTTTAAPILATSVRLLSGDAALQPLVDQLLADQQQMETAEAAYPWITSADLPMAHEYAQNALSTMLATSIIGFNYNAGNVAIAYGQPYAWDAPDANPQQLLTYGNPDDQYSSLPLTPGNTYTMTVHPPAGPNGTSDVTFLFASGDGVSTPYHSISTYNLDQATPNPDGSYTLVFSSTPQPGNWVDIPADADRTIVRDSVGNWGLPHDSFSITEQGVAAPNPLHPPLLTDTQIEKILGPTAANGPNELASGDYYGQLATTEAPAPNTVSDAQPTHSFMPGPLLTGDNQYLSAGDYALQPDQALIIKVPEIGGSYASAMLANAYGQTAPDANQTGNLNTGNTFHDPDGYTYYVVSSQNPGVANWLNDNGAADGGIWLRFQGIQNPPSSPVPISTEVVNLADVKQYLPADTPTVTDAQYASIEQLRMFEWDYTKDQNYLNDPLGWIGANLEYDQIKAAVGPQAFDEIFGGQGTQYGTDVDVPTVAQRMTDPALMPSLTSLVNDIVADPNGALLALKDNLSLAANDVVMPTELAAERLLVLIEQTTQALQADVSGGHWSQLLTDLGTGVQGLGTIVDETLTDPATSITAGFLNARDDLAVPLMNAASYATSPGGAASVTDSLSELVQTLSQVLNPTTALDNFTSMSTDLSAQIAAQGADLAPIAASMAPDLLPW